MKLVSKFLLIVLLAFTANTAFSQYRPKPVDSLVKKLKQKGIDTILIYMNGSTWHKTKCDCLKSDVIYAAQLIYKLKGKIYKVDFSCCNEDSIVEMTKCLSIPYFLSLKEVFKEEDNFYKNLRKNKKFPPPIPTDNPFENVELIIPKYHKEVGLNSYESGEGYATWKKYPWINKEIKLIKLIRQDLMLSSE
jgi:hypothetical protein